MLLKVADVKGMVKVLRGVVPSLMVLMSCGLANDNTRMGESGGCPADCQCQRREDRVVASDGVAEFGIDVSHHNGDIDWRKLGDTERLLFVYVKATEGSTYVDKNYRANVKGAMKAGYLTGSYHFFRMTSSAHGQFDNFMRAMNSVGKQDLIPMVDVETADKHSVAELQDSLRVFIQLVKEHYGVVPMIYGTNRSYNEYCAPDFNKYHLYIGRYGEAAPIIRGAGSHTVWQYSEKGILPGIPKPVDLARFHPSHSIEEIKMPDQVRE